MYTITSGGASAYSSVTIASQQLTLADGQRYLVTSTTAAWLAFGTNPTATAGAANMTYLPANTPIAIHVQAGNTKLAVVRDAVDGKISATLLM